MLHFTVELRDAHFGLQNEFGGEIAQRDNHLRVDGARLLSKERRAHLDFLGLGVAVRRRTAFQHIRDEHVALAIKPSDFQQSIELLASSANERHALQILVPPRCLANYQHARVRVALAENGLRSAFGKWTLMACGHLLAQLVQRNMRFGHD